MQAWLSLHKYLPETVIYRPSNSVNVTSLAVHSIGLVDDSGCLAKVDFFGDGRGVSLLNIKTTSDMFGLSLASS